MVNVKRVVLWLLFVSYYWIWRLWLLIRRQSQTGYFYCKRGSMYSDFFLLRMTLKNAWNRNFTNVVHSLITTALFESDSRSHTKWTHNKTSNAHGHGGKKGWLWGIFILVYYFQLLRLQIRRKRVIKGISEWIKSHVHDPQKIGIKTSR